MPRKVNVIVYMFKILRIYFESMFVNEKHILPYASGVLKKKSVQI